MNTLNQAAILSHLVLIHRNNTNFPTVKWRGPDAAAMGYNVGDAISANLRSLNGVVVTDEGPYSPTCLAIVNGNTNNFVWGAFAANAVEQPEAAILFLQCGGGPFFAQYSERGIEYLALG